MIFLSSYQLPLLSALLLLALSPSPVLFLTLSLLHGDSDTAEMLHLNDIPDESHADRPLSDFQCFILFIYFFTHTSTHRWVITSGPLHRFKVQRQGAVMMDVPENACFQALLCTYAPH